MNKIYFADEFKRKVKPLAKKYHTLRNTVDKLGEELVNDPFLGESYGANLYKIRLADESKGKGKRGGFRVLYYLSIQNSDGIDIFLVTIFDKSERDTITKKEAEALLKIVLLQ